MRRASARSRSPGLTNGVTTRRIPKLTFTARGDPAPTRVQASILGRLRAEPDCGACGSHHEHSQPEECRQNPFLGSELRPAFYSDAPRPEGHEGVYRKAWVHAA